MNNIAYLIPALGALGLVAMAIKSAWVSKQDAGDAKMQELAGFIAKGATAEGLGLIYESLMVKASAPALLILFVYSSITMSAAPVSVDIR